MTDIPQTPQSRIENYLGKMIGQETAKTPSTVQSRIEAYLYALLGVVNTRYSVPKKITDRMYYVEYEQLDYEYSNGYFTNKFSPGGACSAVRSGNYFGRNYDWYYNHSIVSVIGRKATQGKYASIGVAGMIIDDALAESGNGSALYSVLPFMTLDGTNSEGVTCCINVVPALDKRGITTGTNPGKETVPMCCLPRMILDNCNSAASAINKIQNDWNIIGPNGSDMDQEAHIMIFDDTNTYIVEFINNAPVVIDNFVGDKPIMTNFYLANYDGSRESLDQYAQGIERYGILFNDYDNVTNIATMKSLMQSVYFTKAYTITNPNDVWYSEFSGKYLKYGDLTKDSPRSDYDELLAVAREMYANKSRDNNSTWETVHSSVYDIASGKVYVSVEEGVLYEEFSIPE